MAKFSGAIPPLLEEPIILGHTLRNVFKQLDSHPKTAPKVSLGVNGLLYEVAPHQLVVPFDPLPPQLLSTQNRTDVLWPLVGVQSQNHGNILFFGEVPFFVGC